MKKRIQLKYFGVKFVYYGAFLFSSRDNKFALYALFNYGIPFEAGEKCIYKVFNYFLCPRKKTES